jgi:AcrR family transcriptional regulator
MTVKGKKRGRPKSAANRLSPGAIIDCSKQLLRETGNVPSIRRIAAQLEVDPMAIYHYFDNKSALLEAVTVSLMEDVCEPADDGEWQIELRSLCSSYLQMLEQYAGLLEIMLSMEAEGPAEVFVTRFQRILAPLDLSDEVLNDALNLVVEYLHGFALAMYCNRDRETLNVEATDGALGFLVRALEREAG